MKTKETVVALLALVFVYGLIAHCTGCFPEAYKPEIAAAGYQAQQMRCVEQYADAEHIDACRAKVRAAWTTCPNPALNDGGPCRSSDAGLEASR